jgi:hypothetical protein
MVHRPVKLPSHLYISPPSPPIVPLSPSTYLSLSPLSSKFPGVLFHETSSTAVALGQQIPGVKTTAGTFISMINSADQRLIFNP